MVSDGIDLKLEELFCLFLLGQVISILKLQHVCFFCLLSDLQKRFFFQGSKADALERLRQVESIKYSASRNSLLRKSDKDASVTDYSLVCQLLIYTLIFYVLNPGCVLIVKNFRSMFFFFFHSLTSISCYLEQLGMVIICNSMEFAL